MSLNSLSSLSVSSSGVLGDSEVFCVVVAASVELGDAGEASDELEVVVGDGGIGVVDVGGLAGVVSIWIGVVGSPAAWVESKSSDAEEAKGISFKTFEIDNRVYTR